VNDLSKVEILRILKLNKDYIVQLHTCDASELAYAAVSYVKVIHPDQTTCYLVMSKSRVALLKTLTLPRLELQGAVLAIRLKETIVNEMRTPIKSIHFWTDSMLNLQYINNEERCFKVFVANRVSEIHLHSKPSQWHYIKGESNPVDLATRGFVVEKSIKKSTLV